MKFLPTIVCSSIIMSLSATSSMAEISNQCTKGTDGRFTLAFNVEPSLVEHSPAVLDAKRSDIGLGGTASERVFSFSRTIASILDSAQAPSDAAAQQAFVQTMIDSFSVPSGKALNAGAGILMPFDDRPQEAGLSAASLLDETSPDAMVPLALFNRFDLAPANWTHCGEHRIVYGKNRPDPTDPFNRFLIIFEAMVPNPAPADGEQGCRRVTEFWAGLTGKSDQDRAKALSEFYYDGKTGLAAGDLEGPVVSFRNYGGDGNRGQVRANAFVTPEWQLREWLTQLTFATIGPKLAFVPVTVKDNPLAQLYHDDISSDTELMSGNIPAAVDGLHGEFVQTLTSQIVPNLMSESSTKYRGLVEGLSNFDLGAAPVTEPTVLINTIGLGNPDKFNEHQSTSQGGDDVPGEPSGSSATLTTLLDIAGASIGSGFPGQTGQTVLNRARAVTCGGCHMTASRSDPGHFTGLGVVIRENADSTVVRWPDVHSGGFVQVNESDRVLSPALTDQFLPFRRYIMGQHLCKDLQPATEPPTEPTIPDPYAMVLAEKNVKVEQVATSARYPDAVIEDLLSGDASRPSGLSTAPVGDMTKLSEAERQGIRMRVGQAIDAARTIERELTEGAFVETRRPH